MSAGAAYSTGTTISFSYTAGSDLNLLQHNVKACQQNDCTTSCAGLVASSASPQNVTVISDAPYFACVQSQDKAGNTSAWVASLTTITVDTTDPMPPTNVAVPADWSTSASVAFTWSSGTDTNFRYHNVMACSDHDCTQNCTAVQHQTGTSQTISGLTYDQSYFACVQSEDSAGRTSAVVPSLTAVRIDNVPPTAPASISFPGYPGGFDATKSFSLSWTNSTDDHFLQHNVKACSDTLCSLGCTTPITSVSSPVTVTVLADGTYYGCVQGQDLAGNTSAFIYTPTPLVVDTTPPAPPSFVAPAVTFSASTSVNFAWSAGSDTNFLQHNFKLCAAGDCNSSCGNDDTTTGAAITANGLLDNHTYFACVQSQDKAGNTSAWIPATLSVTVDTTPPSTPGSVSAGGPFSASSSVTFSWTAGSDTNFSTHNVKACTNSDCLSNCTTPVTEMGTSHLMTGLLDGSVYFACVQSEDKATNTSAWVHSTDTVTIDLTVPTVPSNVAPGSPYSSSATVSFGYTPGSDLNLLQHNVKACQQNDCSTNCVGLVTSSGSPQSVTVSADGVYFGCVQSQDKANNTSAWVPSTLSVTVDTIKPTAPTNVSAGPTYSSSATLSFAYTAGTDLHLLQHNVKACAQNDCSSDCVGGVSSNASPQSVTVVSDGPYFACVQSQDQAGNTSAWVASGTSSTVDTTPPSAPANVTVPQWKNSTSLAVTFTSGTDTNFSTHNVKACANNDCLNGCLTAIQSVSSPATLSGLVNGTSYFACVQALDLAGNHSAYIPSGNAVTIDTTPPGGFAITGPANPTYSSSQSVTFNPATDATHYQLTISTTSNCASPTHVIGSPWSVTTSKNVNLPDGLYYVCMSALDDAQNSTDASNNGYSFEVETSKVHVSYTSYSGGTNTYKLRYGNWQNGSPALTTIVSSVAHPIDNRSSLAIDSDEKIHVAFAISDATSYYHLGYAYNVGIGGNIGVETAASGSYDDTLGFALAMALTKTNTVSMVYRYHYNDTVNQNDLMVDTNGTSGNFAAPTTIDEVQNISSAIYRDHSLAMNSTDVGELVYTYYNGTKNIMRHVNNSPTWAGRTTDETITWNNGPCSDFMFASMALSTTDKLHVAYICTPKVPSSGCRVYYTTNTTGTWVHTLVDSVKSGSGSCTTSDITQWYRPSIALDGANGIHISYVNIDSSTLYYAEPNGQGGFTTTQLDSGGFNNAIALDSVGKTYIFYRTTSGPADLMMITNNSGNWVSYTIDASSNITGIGSAAVTGAKGVSNR